MTPVKFTTAAKTLVDAYNGQELKDKSAAYWSDDAVAALKKELKDHYIAEQKHRCAYCRQKILTNNNAVWDAEHIVSKKKNPEYMFEPLNLAISCKDCNIAKGEAEVRRVLKAKYSINSSDYLIVHPHFDQYEAHIVWIGLICASFSPKGAATVAMCNLTRYAASSVGETENIMDSRFSDLAWNLLTAKTVLDLDVAVAGMKVIVQSKAEM